MENEQLPHPAPGPLGSLQLQRFFSIFFLALATFFASAAYNETAYSATKTAKLSVTVHVSAHTRLNVLYQVPEIAVTDADIQRGYVDTHGASRMEVRSNSRSGYLLVFEGIGGPFKEVYVYGLANEVRLSGAGAFIHQPYSSGSVTMELSYRLVLSEGAKPGIYSWPLSISAQPA